MDIIVKNLCKTYDRNRVLDHFSCTFREKKMTCIMGKSGIGKSTLLSILMGLEKADEGTVSGMEHQKISAIFQENRLFENLDAVTRPCTVEKIGKYKFRIVLTQGLNRQIRRMSEALGYKVTELVRVRIMNIELGNLKRGEYRSLTDEELNELYEELKGSENAPGGRGR